MRLNDTNEFDNSSLYEWNMLLDVLLWWHFNIYMIGSHGVRVGRTLLWTPQYSFCDTIVITSEDSRAPSNLQFANFTMVDLGLYSPDQFDPYISISTYW